MFCIHKDNLQDLQRIANNHNVTLKWAVITVSGDAIVTPINIPVPGAFFLDHAVVNAFDFLADLSKLKRCKYIDCITSAMNDHYAEYAALVPNASP